MCIRVCVQGAVYMRVLDTCLPKETVKTPLLHRFHCFTLLPHTVFYLFSYRTPCFKLTHSSFTFTPLLRLLPLLQA